MTRFSLLAMIAGLLLIFSFSKTIHAQTQPKPTLAWQKSIGGGQIDLGSSVISTFDSAYVVLAKTESNSGDIDSNHGGYDFYIAKLSASGSILWKRSLGGSGYDMGSELRQTSDSGFIVVGYTTSGDGNVGMNKGMYDAWIIKLDKNGYIQWQKTYGGTKNDAALSAHQTFDGGYIVAGWSASNDGDLLSNKGDEDCWILKLNATGAIIWQQSLGGTSEDHFTSVIQTADSGYLAVGSVQSSNGDITGHHGSSDIWVVKFTNSGSVTWKATLGGSDEEHCGEHAYAGSVLQARDGGYVIGAYSNSINGNVTGNHGDYDAWIVKLTGAGVLSWQKSLGGTGDDEAFSIVEMPDSSIIGAGLAQYANGDVDTVYGGFDAWVFKVSKTGSLQWEQVFGGSNKELAFYLDKTKDTSVIITGYCSGNGGQVTGYKGGLNDIWVAKLKMTPIINSISAPSLNRLTVAPNPATDRLRVYGAQQALHLKLFNVAGQEVRDTYGDEMSLDGLPAAIYVLKIYDHAGSLLAQEKLVKQ